MVYYYGDLSAIYHYIILYNVSNVMDWQKVVELKFKPNFIRKFSYNLIVL